MWCRPIHTKPLVFSILVLLLLIGCKPSDPTPVTLELDTKLRNEQAKVRLLFDISHSKAIPKGAKLDKTHFHYLEVSNWERLLGYLNLLGVSVDIVRKGPLTTELLKKYQIACLYYPMDKGQPLTTEELQALEEWTRSGGGLLAVGEHSNADNSAEILNPLLQKFGMKLPYSTLVDADQTFAFAGWDKQTQFLEHPVTEGVRELALFSSGAVQIEEGHPDRPVGLAMSSKTAFLDHWDPESQGGFVGDFIRQDTEPQGVFYGVAAATPGKGRVLVMADHNAFSGVSLYYADNLKLALQMFNWLSGGQIALPQEGALPLSGYTILLPETTRPSNIFTPQSFEKGMASEAYFNFYSAINRDEEVSIRTTSNLRGEYDALFIAPQKERFTSGFLDYVKDFHSRGGLVAVLVEGGTEPKEGTTQVLEALQVDPGEPGPEKRGEVEVQVQGQSMGRAVLEYREWPEATGQTLVSLLSEENKTVPVVIEPKPRLQLFLQSQIVRNDAFQTPGGRVLGTGPLKPNEEGLLIYRVLWAWLDILKSRKATTQD